VFKQELTYCDGSDPTIRDNMSCSVPVNALRALPYSLDWGDSVFIKVAALNQYGTSFLSDEGNGALLMTNPAAPVNLVEDFTPKTESSIGLSWQEGSYNGGGAVSDY
jgi:hypothetical protein